MCRCVSLFDLLIYVLCSIREFTLTALQKCALYLNTVCFCLHWTWRCFSTHMTLAKEDGPWCPDHVCVFLFDLTCAIDTQCSPKLKWSIVPYLFLTPKCMQDIFRLLTIENLFKGPPELAMGHSGVHSRLDTIISFGHATKSTSLLQSSSPSEPLNKQPRPTSQQVANVKCIHIVPKG